MDTHLKDVYFHELEDGKIQYQGRIVGREGDTIYILERFSFADGRPTRIRFSDMDYMWSDDFVMYTSKEEMILAYDREREKDRGSRRPQPLEAE